MSRRPVVVDGSNLATEGRSMPSLAQLDEAVRAWLAENPDDEVIVVVDASFSYRIDESERKTFEEAEDAGEVVCPPAGAVGRGDGFLLRIADRVDAAVLSNDSFQEFHGEYKWLFDSGRLLGGKPVPNVGWIFTPRTPVRGPKSRMAVRDAQRATKSSRSAPVVKAIAQATAEAIEVPQPADERRARRRGGRAAETAPVTTHEAVNEPLPFVTFIAEHPLGTEVEGTVVSFTSHGAFVDADGARCYVPVVGLGDPPPRTAKAVLKAGEVRTFVVQALDPPRRGIELALPEVARVAGAPTDETVEAEIGARRSAPQRSAAGIPPPPRGRRSPAVVAPTDDPVPEAVDAMEPIAPVEAVGDPAVRSPRRSPRRRGSGATRSETTADAGEAATTAPEEAPARRSRRAPSPEPLSSDTAVADEAGTPSSGRRRKSPAASTAEVADTSPTAAPRTRRTTKKVAAAASTGASAIPADEAAEPETETPGRSRRPPRKASPVARERLAPVDTGELLAVTTDKTPVRVPRSRKARATPVVADTAEDADTAKAVKAAATTKRRVAKRGVEPAQTAIAEPPPAAPRRRAPAKKAAATSAAKVTKSPAKKAPATKSTAKKAARPAADESGASATPAGRTRRRAT
ncbi:MAG: S1 RNA-binding domain-containing protein [Actinomycetota bacterium]|nr:S1 RNA-binding domain-containing protein [Actinomycetota bacterium]